MQNNKNKPGNKEGCQRTAWEIGVTAQGDIFIHFANGENHFRCTMDDLTAEKMGEALLDTASRRANGERLVFIKGGNEGIPQGSA